MVFRTGTEAEVVGPLTLRVVTVGSLTLSLPRHAPDRWAWGRCAVRSPLVVHPADRELAQPRRQRVGTAVVGDTERALEADAEVLADPDRVVLELDLEHPSLLAERGGGGCDSVVHSAANGGGAAEPNIEEGSDSGGGLEVVLLGLPIVPGA